MSPFKVFVTRSDFDEASLERLQQKFIVECYSHPKCVSRDALLSGVKDKDALFCHSLDRIDKEVIEAAGSQLKVIATTSIGYEHIDLEECKKRSIVVCNGPNPLSAGAVAEMSVGLMLAAARRIVEASQAIQRGLWVESYNPMFLLGRGLVNSTVGIVGMGRIGYQVLRRIIPFDVAEVYYNDIFHPIPQANELGAKYLPFEELLSKSDFVVATCNLSPQSRGIFNAKAFSLMKKSAIFVNTSRGGIVDQEALYEALKSHQIKAAAIDVMYPEPLPKDHKLFSLPNIILLPHIAGAEETGVRRLAELAAENIEAVLEGRPPLTPVPL